MKTCVNCGNVTDTPFCPSCGQRMEVQRVSFAGIVSEFFSKWIGFDTQFGRTIKGMTVAPGHVINSYLQGNRTKYIGPLGYVVIMTALVILSFDLFGIQVQDFLESAQSTVSESFQDESLIAQQTEMQQQFAKKVNEAMAKNYRYMSVALIPFWSFAMWLFYRDRGLNYMERVAAVSYITSQGLWITILMLGIFALTGIYLIWQSFCVALIYYVYALVRTFPYENRVESIVKALFSYVMGYLLFMLTAIIATFIYLIFYFLQNPELLKPG